MLDPGLALLIELVKRSDDVSVDGGKLEKLILARDIDWSDFLVRALWHKVAFVAYAKLRVTGLLDVALSHGGLPLLLANHWRQLYAVNIRRNQVMEADLFAIQHAFDEHAINACVGKGGPLLIGRGYTVDERKMYDLDFLGDRAQLGAIRAAMRDADFRMGHVSHARGELVPLPSDELRKWLLLSRGLPNFIRMDRDPTVGFTIAQVQFKIGSTVSGGAVDATEIINLAKPRLLGWSGNGPCKVSCPSDVDTLIQLCLHIARETRDPEHAEWKMSWNLVKLCDLDRFANTSKIDVNEFVARANQLGFLQHCHYALAATDAALPSSKLKALLNASSTMREGGHSAFPLSREEVIDGIAALGSEDDAGLSSWTQVIGVKTT